MRYWYRVSNGNLVREVSVQPSRGHSEYAQTDDVGSLPGPIQCCKWNGSAVVADSTLVADYKAMLRAKVEESALLGVSSATLTTPWGDFPVRRQDIDAYQMIAFSAIYALQTSGSFSVTLRRANGTTVTVTAGQFMQFINLIGERMAAKLSARNAKLDQLASATAEELKAFEP
jgi:hypothetical protein